MTFIHFNKTHLFEKAYLNSLKKEEKDISKEKFNLFQVFLAINQSKTHND